MSETKWLGKYRAIVMDNNDPERRGRIRVQCPTVLGNYLSSWCEPCIPYATDYAGDYYVPPVNEAIWVEFEEGNVDKPIWGGGWYKVNSSPLTPDAKPTDYRFISFKNSIIRMGDKEFIFEIRNGDESYTVRIDTSTWLGLTYIGSKSEQELNDLEALIVNKTYLLETFPEEVHTQLENLDVKIVDVANNFSSFLTTAYNPFTKYVEDMLISLSESLDKLSHDLSDKLTEVDNNLRDLQSQIDSLNQSLGDLNSINSRLDGHRDAYNQTIESIASSSPVVFTYWLMA